MFPPVPLIRKKHIIKKLLGAGAVSPEKAVTFAQAGIMNPDGFRAVTRRLTKHGVIVPVQSGRYRLDVSRIKERSILWQSLNSQM